MEWSKIKNIILVLLLLVNAFLLVQVADREHKAAKYEEEGRAGAVEVLRAAGIEVMGKLPRESGLTPLRCGRDREGEEAMALALLGAAETTDGGLTYEGGKGQARFSGNGSFRAAFSDGAWPLSGTEPERHAVEFMKQVGYDCQVIGQGEGAVTVRQTWQGASVFNCTAVLTYEGGSLRSIEGVRLLGAPVAASGKTLDLATVLIRFLGGVRDGGYICKEIRSMAPGYRMELEPGGSARLDCGWRVEADTGDFFVSAVDGSVENLA